MCNSEDLEHFRLIMSIASLLELCHSEKMYVVFLPSGSLQKWIVSAKYLRPINVRLTAINVNTLGSLSANHILNVSRPCAETSYYTCNPYKHKQKTW